jgi:catalase
MIKVADDQNSLKISARGPTTLEDFHFQEKIFHFDHERIPERVVHARGFGAHGFFENYESLADITRADLFQRPGEKTPLFTGCRNKFMSKSWGPRAVATGYRK